MFTPDEIKCAQLRTLGTPMQKGYEFLSFQYGHGHGHELGHGLGHGQGHRNGHDHQHGLRNDNGHGHGRIGGALGHGRPFGQTIFFTVGKIGKPGLVSPVCDH